MLLTDVMVRLNVTYLIAHMSSGCLNLDSGITMAGALSRLIRCISPEEIAPLCVDLEVA